MGRKDMSSSCTFGVLRVRQRPTTRPPSPCSAQRKKGEGTSLAVRDVPRAEDRWALHRWRCCAPVHAAALELLHVLADLRRVVEVARVGDCVQRHHHCDWGRAHECGVIIPAENQRLVDPSSNTADKICISIFPSKFIYLIIQDYKYIFFWKRRELKNEEEKRYG